MLVEQPNMSEKNVCECGEMRTLVEDRSRLRSWWFRLQLGWDSEGSSLDMQPMDEKKNFENRWLNDGEINCEVWDFAYLLRGPSVILISSDSTSFELKLDLMIAGDLIDDKIWLVGLSMMNWWNKIWGWLIRAYMCERVHRLENLEIRADLWEVAWSKYYLMREERKNMFSSMIGV